jgi:hypothetical protein
MNNIAISPNIFMYALQNQNVERKIAKKIDLVPPTVAEEQAPTSHVEDTDKTE